MRAAIRPVIGLLFVVGALLVAHFSAPHIASAASSASFAGCPQHFYKGQAPRILTDHPAKQRELCFDGFAILHSGESKTPVYVAERLNRQRLEDAHLERTDRFYEEARLPSAERAHLADYKAKLVVGSTEFRFDRGHNAPAADMSTPEAMAQSFSLANMVPQAPQNNRGIWAKNVEKPTRQYVKRASGDVFVLTGPVYGGGAAQPPTLGPGRVWIPKYLFKLVYHPARHEAWAFWVENTDNAQMTRPIGYRELVQRTGIEFLPGGL